MIKIIIHLNGIYHIYCITIYHILYILNINVDFSDSTYVKLSYLINIIPLTINTTSTT